MKKKYKLDTETININESPELIGYKKIDETQHLNMAVLSNVNAEIFKNNEYLNISNKPSIKTESVQKSVSSTHSTFETIEPSKKKAQFSEHSRKIGEASPTRWSYMRFDSSINFHSASSTTSEKSDTILKRLSKFFTRNQKEIVNQDFESKAKTNIY